MALQRTQNKDATARRSKIVTEMRQAHTRRTNGKQAKASEWKKRQKRKTELGKKRVLPHSHACPPLLPPSSAPASPSLPRTSFPLLNVAAAKKKAAATASTAAVRPSEDFQ
jgi:hypothetical protein